MLGAIPGRQPHLDALAPWRVILRVLWIFFEVWHYAVTLEQRIRFIWQRPVMACPVAPSQRARRGMLSSAEVGALPAGRACHLPGRDVAGWESREMRQALPWR